MKKTEIYEQMQGSDDEQIKYLTELYEECKTYEWGWQYLRGIISGILAVLKLSDPVDSFLLDLEIDLEKESIKKN